MKATIVTIGDEILIGQILDTNSRYISQQLNTIGVAVVERTSIGDTSEAITSTLDRALAQSRIVILTGGLGPTKDDLTKHTLNDYFDSSLRYDTATAEHVERLLSARGVEFNELNRAQALVPECCQVLHNAHGTAPGMWFERDDSVVISLPGVPFEMQHLMEDEVVPHLRERFALRTIVHRTMITSGLAESMLAARIEAWESALPSMLHLAYLPAPNIVRLRLSAYDVEEDVAREIIDKAFGELYDIIPEHIVGYEDATVEAQVHARLLERGATLAIAESCTGGAIASRFTAMSGASQYLQCGVVAYSNRSKSEVLGVSSDDIARYGAVSEQVACQMAEGVRRVAHADYAIATTGIAGPTGGTAEKPVGTVWFGVATPERCFAVLRNCGTDRAQIVSRATATAISLLRDELK